MKDVLWDALITGGVLAGINDSHRDEVIRLERDDVLWKISEALGLDDEVRW